MLDRLKVAILEHRRDVVRFVVLTGVLATMMFVDVLCRMGDLSGRNLNGWIYVFWRSGAFALMLTAFALVLPMRLSQVLFSIYFAWSFFVMAAQLFCRIEFGIVFGGELFGIAVGSSWSEIAEFVGMYMTPVGITVAIVTVAIGVGVVCAAWKSSGYRFERRPWLLFALLFIPFAGLAACLPPRFDTGDILSDLECFTVLGSKPICIFHELEKSVQGMIGVRDAARNPKLPARLQGPESDANIVGLFVIGESATRNRMSIYGYERKTTPRFDALADELFVFRHVRAVSPFTTKALRMLLTESTEREPGHVDYILPAFCARAGYVCTFYSNQDHWGEWDGADEFFFSDCTTKVWIGDLPGHHGRYDACLVPYAKDEIAKPGNRAVFLHLIGSHMEPQLRCPVDMAIFGKNSRSDWYDNSIYFTDAVLGSLVDALAASGRPAFLVYISDHGETPGARSWRDRSHPDLWEIPFAVWLSPEYRKMFPDLPEALRESAGKSLASDGLLHGLVRLFGIAPLENWDPADDFLSKSR